MLKVREVLKELSESLPSGSVSHEHYDAIAACLSDCWKDLRGSHHRDGMRPDKLFRRMENVEWNPPVLTFEIERHGGTVLGSTRAEVQCWTIDFSDATMVLGGSRRRQLYAMDTRLDVRPIAQDLARKIVRREQDERLKWRGDVVEVLTSVIIPATNRQTTAGRRKRLAAQLEKLLAEYGWKRTGFGRLRFEKTPDNAPI